VDSVEAVWAGAAPRPTDPQPDAAELIHDLLEAIYAGYYVVDRP
jgi:hypothetical protein